MSGGSNFRRWRSYNTSCQHPSGSRQSLITTPGTRSSIMTRACPRPPTNCRFQLECPKISFKEAWSSRVGRSARTRTVVSVPLITTSNRLFCDTIPCNSHATPDSPWQKPPRTSTGCAKLLGTLSHAVGQRSRGVVTAAGSFPRGRSAGEAKGGITGIPADKLPTWSKALAENAGASAFSRTLHPRPNVSCARPFAAGTAACVCSCHSNSASAPLLRRIASAAAAAPVRRRGDARLLPSSARVRRHRGADSTALNGRLNPATWARYWRLASATKAVGLYSPLVSAPGGTRCAPRRRSSKRSEIGSHPIF